MNFGKSEFCECELRECSIAYNLQWYAGEVRWRREQFALPLDRSDNRVLEVIDQIASHFTQVGIIIDSYVRRAIQVTISAGCLNM